MSNHMRTSLFFDRAMANFSLAIFIAILFNFCAGVILIENKENTSRPETTISQGIVRGLNMVTRRNRTVFGFVGIPYAEPPIGNLRFRGPKPARGWNGTLDASNVNSTIVCPQLDAGGILVGVEDCLNLNVYTPKIPSTENCTLLPVMLYVIGGAFTVEKNYPLRFGPDYLLDEDVVLVIPNFRVGVLGFLSTGDEVAPGNYALKDVVQALKWTQENIRYFGGDPNRVTLFGGSSGAVSVALLSLSHSTKGLFHKIITQSGSALTPHLKVPREKYAKRSTKLAEYLGCPTANSVILINCLRSMNVSQIVDTNSAFLVWRMYPDMIWYPTIEPDVEGALITDHPRDLIASGKMQDLPWMSMVTWDEGLAQSIKFFESEELFNDFFINVDTVLPMMVDYRDSVDNVTAYTEALKSYYLNDLTANRSVLLNNLTQLIGDALFMYPVYSFIQQQSRFAESPQYFCVLKYRGTFSKSYSLSGGSTEYTGVPHGDEIIYLFPYRFIQLGPPDAEFTNDDWSVVDTVTQMWTSFASNGTPTTAMSNTTWKAYSMSLNNYLRIGNGQDTTLEMEHDLFTDRMRFWKELDAASSSAMRHSFQALTIVLCLQSLSYF